VKAAILEKEKGRRTHAGPSAIDTTTVRDQREPVKPEKAERGELGDGIAPCNRLLSDHSDALDVIVSTVPDAKSTATTDTNVLDLLRSIRSGKWRHQIEPIRTLYHRAVAEGLDPKKAVQARKATLPAMLWSGRFTTRKESVSLPKKLVRHSGILCADLDRIEGRIAEIRSKLKCSPHVLAVFLSPTGSGLKVLVKVRADAESHLTSFLAVKAHIRELADCDIDDACKDITRLCFVSYDPNCWLRTSEPVEIEGCTSRPSRTSRPSSSSSSSSSSRTLTVRTVESVGVAVSLAVPTRKGQNHLMLYKLAGALWAYEATTRATLDDSQLRAAFKDWHHRAKAFLSPDQSEEEYYLEFMDAWQNVKSPLSESWIDAAWQKSADAPTPPEAVAAGFTEKKICRCIAFCRELQVLRGDEPFELSPYIVAKLFGQKSHSTAAHWLGGLCGLNILTKITPGDFTKARAATYRYNRKDA